jgi:hypothetical protein
VINFLDMTEAIRKAVTEQVGTINKLKTEIWSVEVAYAAWRRNFKDSSEDRVVLRLVRLRDSLALREVTLPPDIQAQLDEYCSGALDLGGPSDFD